MAKPVLFGVTPDFLAREGLIRGTNKLPRLSAPRDPSSKPPSNQTRGAVNWQANSKLQRPAGA